MNSLKNAAIEVSGLTNLTAEVKSDLKSIIKYLDTFECILMSAVWIKILTMIHEVNLIIESRDATLDVEMMNISLLQGDIKNLREKWDDILKEACYVSNNLSVSDSLKLTVVLGAAIPPRKKPKTTSE